MKNRNVNNLCRCISQLKLFLFLFLTIIPVCFVSAQQISSDYDYSKNGILILDNFQHFENIKKANPALYNQQVETIKNFVNELIAVSPMLTEKKGFDLKVGVNGYGNMDEQSKWLQKDFEYGIMTELCFQFQLFYPKGGKWANYCPNWCFKLNAPTYGKSLPYQSLHSKYKVLNEAFLVFPHVKEIVPGVNFHYNDAGKGELVFFNPSRPDYWVPVPLKEIVDARMKYTAENEKAVYEMMKAQADKLSEAELNGPAYYDNSEEYYLLGASSNSEGTPIMRFNPDYWDRSLPRSAIQYFTLDYFEIADMGKWQKERESFYKKNNGRIDYSVEAAYSIQDFERLSGVIQKK